MTWNMAEVARSPDQCDPVRWGNTFGETSDMEHPLPLFTAVALYSVFPITAAGQCTDQVTHISGSQIIGGINVTVGSIDTVDVNTVYCTETTPYIVGYDNDDGSGTGSYTFTFAPAIEGASLNASGISEALATHLEHMRLFINGAHYAVPAPGVALSCDAFGVVTPDGDLGPCSNCSVSGMGQILLPGPISSLTVQDTVLLGEPGGAIFSLFICGAFNGIPANSTSTDLLLFPNPATTSISLPEVVGPTVTVEILDPQGRMVHRVQRSHGDRSPLNVSDLPRGTYVLVMHGTSTTYHKLVLD